MSIHLKPAWYQVLPHLLQLNAQQNPNSNHAATCSIPFNTFSTTTNIEPPFVTPVKHPRYGHIAPIPLCWAGSPHFTPPPPASENASLIKALTDALISKRNDPLRNGSCPIQWGSPAVTQMLCSIQKRN